MQRNLRRVTEFMTVFVTFVLLAWSAAEVLAAAPLCAEKGRMMSGVWKLTCTGACEKQNCPPLANRQGGPSGATYKFCACPEEQESPCCHLVILNDPPPPPADPFDTAGACYAVQQCGNDEACHKHRDPSTNEYYHVCATP